MCQESAQESQTATAGCAVECWCYLLEQVEADPELMDRVNTGDESWFFQYDPEDQTSKFVMAFKGLTKAKESANVQVKSEMQACALLGFHGHCSQTVGSC